MTAGTRELDEALLRVFGHARFRPGQREVVEAVVANRPVIGVMPTGAGKSLCYQLPAVVTPGTTIVISPLIALMKDQVDALRARGVEAAFINSSLTPEERRQRMVDAVAGRYKLLYVAPERFRSPHFVDALARVQVARVAVDEAHCISQWGHDFRPDYVRLGDALRERGLQRVCAFTATATPLVRDDIVRVLGLRAPEIFVHGFRRENLMLRVVPIQRMRDKVLHLERLLRSTAGAGIVYAATRKNVEAVAASLIPAGVGVGVYHGGLTDEERVRAQERFMGGELRVMVATNAFGMGIDRSDIRFVVHYDMPGSVEAYYQEAGRAGRDGLPAECAILFSYADARIHEFFIDRIGEDRPAGDPDIERLKDMERQKLRRIAAFCYSERCRHRELLEYFGERTSSHSCDACDNCLAEQRAPVPDWAEPRLGVRERVTQRSSAVQLTEGRELSEEETVVLQKLLSAYARSNGRVPDEAVLRLVRGADGELPQDLRASRSFGILAGTKVGLLQSLVRELLARRVLERASVTRRASRLTAFGGEVMRRRATIRLDVPPFARARRAEVAALPDMDAGLYERLVALRKELAQEAGMAPFMVAHNVVLERMAAAAPVTADDLLAIKGVGEQSLERFGYRFLEVIREHVGG